MLKKGKVDVKDAMEMCSLSLRNKDFFIELAQNPWFIEREISNHNKIPHIINSISRVESDIKYKNGNKKRLAELIKNWNEFLPNFRLLLDDFEDKMKYSKSFKIEIIHSNILDALWSHRNSIVAIVKSIEENLNSIIHLITIIENLTDMEILEKLKEMKDSFKKLDDYTKRDYLYLY